MPDDFINFLTASPSSYHAAHTGAHLLNDHWDAQPGGDCLIRGGALIAWHIPTQLPTNPAFRIIGAHTDSPGFKLKHTPDHTTYGFNQAAVEIYGGPIISSWFDRDLKLAGIITHTDGTTHLYLHRRASDLPPQVGVLVEYEGGDDTLAHQVAMHIAAMSPVYVTRDEIPADVVENERRIAEATAREEGKPEGAIPRIIEGRLGGFYKDVVLLDQLAVWEDKKTVGDVLKAAGAQVKRFARLAVGA